MTDAEKLNLTQQIGGPFIGIPIIVCKYFAKGTILLVEEDRVVVIASPNVVPGDPSVYPGEKPAIWVDSPATLEDALDKDFCKRAAISPVSNEELRHSIKGEGDATEAS